MTGQIIGQIILWLVVTVVAVAIFFWILQWLYRRSTKEVAFVRTGFLGERVVIDGGAFVWPIIHDITPVNMNTLPLAVSRTNDQALITKDRMRIDVHAEFYVRVRQTRSAVAMAAATLGRRTLDPERLDGLLAGKFESALRAAAAEMSMSEMHEGRHHYVARVQTLAQDDLEKNGLELESVAIIDIDQTALEYFNPSNRFDAEGLTELIKEIEERRTLRNNIEQDSMIRIRARNLEAEKQALDIERESEEARLTQERDVEFRRAQQRAELARERAERDTEAETSQITAREAIEKARISNERSIAEARIASDREVRAREISRTREIEAEEIAAREATETARILQERAVSEARITNEQETQAREIARQKAIEAQEIAAREATERARIEQERIVDEARIARERAVEEARISKDRETQALEIERQRTIRDAEIAANEANERRRMAQDLLLAQTRIKGEEDIRQREIARQKSLDEAEITARETVERLRILQAAEVSEARIGEDRRVRELEIARQQAVDAAEIAAHEAVEAARIAREKQIAATRIAADEETKALEIERNKAIDSARIAADEAVEQARIAQKKTVEAERIAAEQAIRAREITKDEEIEAAEIARREAVEKKRVLSELELEQERIASQRTREVIDIERRQAVEAADEERVVALSDRKAKRAAAEGSVKQAEIAAQRDVEAAEVAREQAVEAARLERRRSLEQLEVARVQALREAEIGSRDDVERARIASERGLDEVRIGHETERRRLEVERERNVETAADGEGHRALPESRWRRAPPAPRPMPPAPPPRRPRSAWQTVRETEAARAASKSVDVLMAEKAAAEAKLIAEGQKVRSAVEAEAQRLINEAENVLTDPARASLFRRKMLEHVEGIVAASVKPLEKIQDIRIMQLDGVTGGDKGEGQGGSPTDEVINSALRYRVQAPLIDSLLADIGVEGGTLAKQGGLMREASDMQRVSQRGGQEVRNRADPGPRVPARHPMAGRRSRCRASISPRSSMRRHARVWERVRDFNGLPRWHPLVRDSRIENGEPADRIGCVRDFHLQNGDRIRERLLGLSDYDYFCTYSIPREPDAADRLCRDPAADTGDRRRPQLCRMDGRVRLCDEAEAEGLVSGIGTDVFLAGFSALKRQLAA